MAESGFVRPPGEQPTAEQVAALELFSSGESMVIDALAGVGKTTLMCQLAASTPRVGRYVVFNKAAQTDVAPRLPDRCPASTSHSLAFRAVGHRYAARLKSKRMRSGEVASALGIKQILVDYEGSAKRLSPGFLASHVMRAVDSFCNSADDDPDAHHFAYIDGIDEHAADGRRGWENNDAVRELLLPALRRAWADLTLVDGKLRFGHACQPPGTLVRRLTSRMPTGWEDVRIEEVREGDYVVSFDMRQRRGYVRRQGRRVNAAGSRWFDGNLVRIKTERGRSSAVTPDHWAVVRLDAELAAGNYVVYMARRGDQFRIGRTTWRTRSQSNSLGLRRRADAQGADAMWVLGVYPTDEAAATAEAIIGHEHGIPTWTWAGQRTVMRRDEFWQHVGSNIAAATRCLSAHGHDPREPFWQRGDRWENIRRPVKIRARHLLSGMLVCEPDEVIADARGALHTHHGAKGWAAITVARERYAGFVYSLDVDTDHTYVADGIVTGNCYLKIWSLARPRLPLDYLLLDEAQDTAPVLAVVVEAQMGHAQVVMVGDANQQVYCQPVGTMVAVPTIPPDAPPDERCSVEGCGRRRQHAASGRCDQHERQARRDGEPRAIRRRARSADTRHVTIESLRVGDRVVSYYNGHSFKEGREVTATRRIRHEGPVVAVSAADGRASSYTPEHHCVVRIGPSLRGKHVVYLMRRGDQYRVGRCPFFYASQGQQFGVGMRAMAEGADAAWVLSVHDTVAEAILAEALTIHEYGIPGMCFRRSDGRAVGDVDAFWAKVGPNEPAGEACLAGHGRLVEFPLWARGRLGLWSRRPFVTAAANLVDGMRMLPIDAEIRYRNKRSYHTPGHRWVDISVGREWYSGDVVSIEVADHHTYYADGLLTHNSWRGAVDAMQRFSPDHRRSLTRTWRFGPAIADRANGVLAKLHSPLRLTTDPAISSSVGPLGEGEEPDAVLCRTNAAAIETVLSAQQRGQPVHLVGGGTQVASFARAAIDVKAGRWTAHPELACFDSWGAVQDYVEHDPSGSDLALMVRLVEDFGPECILEAVDGTTPERPGVLTVGTAHATKGREWPVVRLNGDLAGVEETPDELRLRYVAITRAREHLDDSVLMDGTNASE